MEVPRVASATDRPAVNRVVRVTQGQGSVGHSELRAASCAPSSRTVCTAPPVHTHSAPPSPRPRPRRIRCVQCIFAASCAVIFGTHRRQTSAASHSASTQGAHSLARRAGKIRTTPCGDRERAITAASQRCAVLRIRYPALRRRGVQVHHTPPCSQPALSSPSPPRLAAPPTSN